MRKTLFRGKRTSDNQWAYGSYVFQDSKHLIFENETTWHHYIDPLTVGQFTGLCDKNGKKIFEGDVVKYRNVANFKVVWWKGRYGCELIGETDEEIYDDAFTLDWNVSTVLEVIGNIYDNPKFLNDGGNEK